MRIQLRTEKQRYFKLESNQAEMVRRIDFLKQQLDDTFYKNTVGYVQLSKQLDQMHHDTLNGTIGSNATISGGELNATFSASNNAAQLTFLDKIKAINESMVSNANSDDIEMATVPSSTTTTTTTNRSRLSSGHQSLNFDTFSMGLSSTLVNEMKNDDDADESVMNCTFLEDSNDNNNESTTPFSEVNENRLNVTHRRTKKPSRYENASKSAKKIARNQVAGDTENQPMATSFANTSAPDVRLLRSGCRSVKKIDYNESLRRKK